MSDETNSRSDAKLKRLPVEIHCEIVERLAAANTTQLDVLAWLKKHHRVESSPASFSRALPFIRQRAKSHAREMIILAKMAERKSQQPQLSDTELFEWGQREFQVMAIADEDPKAWAMIQKAARDKETVALDRQKFQRDTVEMFLKWAQDKKALDLATGSKPHGVKLETLGKQMYGDLW